MSTYRKLLNRLHKRENSTAIKVKILNENIVNYLAEFLDENEINLLDEKLLFLYEKVVKELTANIMENYMVELKAIVPCVTERHGITSTHYCT